LRRLRQQGRDIDAAAVVAACGGSGGTWGFGYHHHTVPVAVPATVAVRDRGLRHDLERIALQVADKAEQVAGAVAVQFAKPRAAVRAALFDRGHSDHPASRSRAISRSKSLL
jgi:hypothetical protein